MDHPAHGFDDVEAGADAAVEVHLDAVATAATIPGSTSIEDGAPSSWRPPWFETMMASAPVSAAGGRPRGRGSLQDQLAAPALLTQSTVVPVEASDRTGSCPGGERAEVRGVLPASADDVAEAPPLGPACSRHQTRRAAISRCGSA